MSDSADTTFKINDLLVSIVPATDGDGGMLPTQIVSGTIVPGPIVTNAALYWPIGGPLCGDDGFVASPAPGTSDPPLLAGAKSLLRAQIAELEAQNNAQASTSLMPTTVEQAAALETKLSAALDAVRLAKSALEAQPAEQTTPTD